ncbi:hypothetical protein ACPFL9_09185 [Paenarthrobacter sp. NyZ202]|uniref:hypothetical protein n=1 Tax=Paenarthrobacter sp. NyZ202 TaxID=3402689 RepID=UPI003CE6EF9E
MTLTTQHYPDHCKVLLLEELSIPAVSLYVEFVVTHMRDWMATNPLAEWRSLGYTTESTIRAAQEKAVLTRSALAHPTLAASVLWADTISRSHADSGQPYGWLRDSAREAAKNAYERLPRASSFASAFNWYSRIINDETRVVLQGEWHAYLRSVYAESISQAATPQEVDRWSRELAAGLIEDQRELDTLGQRLNELLAQNWKDLKRCQDRVADLLVAGPIEHVVAVGVVGALTLDDFRVLVQDDSVVPLMDGRGMASFRRWGNAGGKAADFIRSVSQQRFSIAGREYLPGPQIFLEVLVEAPDAQSALSKASRLLHTLLDSYHAAHPTALLSLYPLAGVAARGSKRGGFTVLDGSARRTETIGLVGMQPIESLTQALRVNSMIRTAPATVTRASFSWVALEAAGIKKSNIKACGKALALLELRQLFFTSYRTFVRYSPTSTRAEKVEVRLSEALSRRARRLRRNANSGPHSAGLQLSAMRLDTAALLRTRLASLHKARALRMRSLIDGVGVSEGGVGYGDPSFATLGSFSTWGAALREWRAGALSANAQALEEISNGMLPEHCAELRVLGDLAGSADLLRERLTTQAAHYASRLEALYSARNLHLHNGIHDVPGEVGLAQLGQSMVDAMLEIWSLWLPHNSQMQPREAVSALAGRFDAVVSELTSGRLLEDLDAGSIAAPGWVLP